MIPWENLSSLEKGTLVLGTLKTWWMVSGSHQGNKLLETGRWGIITFYFIDVSLGKNHKLRARGGTEKAF